MSNSEKQLRNQYNSFVTLAKDTAENVESKILKDVTPEFAVKWREFNKKYLELFTTGREFEANALKDKFLKENS